MFDGGASPKRPFLPPRLFALGDYDKLPQQRRRNRRFSRINTLAFEAAADGAAARLAPSIFDLTAEGQDPVEMGLDLKANDEVFHRARAKRDAARLGKAPPLRNHAAAAAISGMDRAGSEKDTVQKAAYFFEARPLI